MFILSIAVRTPFVGRTVVSRRSNPRDMAIPVVQEPSPITSSVVSTPSSVVLLPLQRSQEPINRAERLAFYIEAMKDMDDINQLIDILCDSDEGLSFRSKELFPDTFNVSFKTGKGETVPRVLPLYTLLRISAVIDKHEGTVNEFNVRAAALFRIDDILEKNTSVTLTQPQAERLKVFKVDSAKIIGKIRPNELALFNHYLDKLISKGQPNIAV